MTLLVFDVSDIEIACVIKGFGGLIWVISNMISGIYSIVIMVICGQNIRWDWSLVCRRLSFVTQGLNEVQVDTLKLWQSLIEASNASNGRFSSTTGCSSIVTSICRCIIIISISILVSLVIVTCQSIGFL